MGWFRDSGGDRRIRDRLDGPAIGRVFLSCGIGHKEVVLKRFLSWLSVFVVSLLVGGAVYGDNITIPNFIDSSAITDAGARIGAYQAVAVGLGIAMICGWAVYKFVRRVAK